MTTPAYILGLDLGQASDYSALAVLERTTDPDPGDVSRPRHSFGVRHLHRWKLGTPYPSVVDDLADLGKRPPLPGAALALDATGVGRPVVDMIRRAKLPFRVAPILITSGHQEGESDGYRTVPKKDLVAVMQTLIQGRRFHVAPALPDAKVLGRELQQFRVKVTAAGNETFESWRERDHDDLVLAVALACWLGSRPTVGAPAAGGERPSFAAPGLPDAPPPWWGPGGAMW